MKKMLRKHIWTVSFALCLLAIALPVFISTGVYGKYAVHADIGRFDLEIAATVQEFAVYSETDGSLTFYYGEMPKVGDTYEDKVVTALYLGKTNGQSGFMETQYSDTSPAPWYDQAANIKSVCVASSIAPASTAAWFYGLENATSIDLTNLDTSAVTDMSNMFRGCTSLTELDLSSMHGDAVTNMNYMFYQCSALTSLDLSHFNTTEALTDMRETFKMCASLQTLTFPEAFVTSNVTNMHSTFSDCNELTELDIRYFDTSKVTDMQWLFSSNPKLHTITVGSGWTVAQLDSTSSWEMFNACSTLRGAFGTSLAKTGDVINNTYAKIDYLNADEPGYLCGAAERDFAVVIGDRLEFYYRSANPYRFDSDSGTVYFGLLDTHFDNTSPAPWHDHRESITTAEVVDAMKPKSTAWWFFELVNVTSIDLTDLDTSAVTDMTSMFRTCQKLTSIAGLSSMNTAAVTAMPWMFYDCYAMTSFDLSGFNTANCENFNSMFGYCISVVSLDLSSFDFSSATSFQSMFLFYSNQGSQSRLEQIIFPSDAKLSTDADSQINMGGMFNSCSRLTELDLSGFNTERVTNMTAMFQNCSALNTVIVGSGWSTAGLTEANSSDSMFEGCTALRGAFGTSLATTNNTRDKTYAKIDYLTIDAPGYFCGEGTRTFAIVIDHTDDGINNATLEFYDRQKSPYRDQSNTGTLFVGFAESTTASSPWRDSHASVITEIKTEDEISPQAVAYWFCYMPNLEKADLSKLNLQNVSSLQNLFGACSKLTTVILSDKFTSGSLTDMSYMFFECTALHSVAFPQNFDASALQTMAYAFYHCAAMQSIDLSMFNTPNLQLLTASFSLCNALQSITFSSDFNTASVTDMSHMFNGCISLTELDLSYFNTTEALTDMRETFKMCASLQTLIFPETFVTSNVTNMYSTFSDCDELTELDIRYFDTSKVTNMQWLFSSNPKLHTITVGSGWTVDQLAENNDSSMFNACNALRGAFGTSLAKTGGVIDKTYAKIDYLNVNEPGYLCADVKHPVAIFHNGSLEFYNASASPYRFEENNTDPLYFGFIDANYAESGAPWAEIADQVTRVVVVDPIAPTYTANWFAGFQNLKTFKNLENLDTSDVLSMKKMFYGCSSMSMLNLRYFDTARVTDMTEMFAGCSAVRTIRVSAELWSTASLTSSDNMFRGCTNLIGGAGTVYTDAVVDGSYAKIDKLGGADAPGYLFNIEVTVSGPALLAQNGYDTQNPHNTQSGTSQYAYLAITEDLYYAYTAGVIDKINYTNAAGICEIIHIFGTNLDYSTDAILSDTSTAGEAQHVKLFLASILGSGMSSGSGSGSLPGLGEDELPIFPSGPDSLPGLGDDELPFNPVELPTETTYYLGIYTDADLTPANPMNYTVDAYDIVLTVNVTDLGTLSATASGSRPVIYNNGGSLVVA